MSQKKAYLYGMAAVLGWSTAATAFKVCLRNLEILEALLLSSIIASIILLSIRCLLHTKSPLPSPLYSLKLGLLMPTGYYLVLFKAYALLPAHYALALNYSWPLFMVILACLLLNEAIIKTQVFGLSLGFVGILLISVAKGQSTTPEPQDLLGLFLALSSAILWSAYWIAMMKSPIDRLSFLTASFLGSIPVLLIIWGFSGKIRLPNLESILSCAFIGLFEMGLSFYFWSRALELSNGVSSVSNLAFLSPFISLIWIYYILGEMIQPIAFGGLVLILISIWIVQINRTG